MRIGVSVTGIKELQAKLGKYSNQLPFAASKALNTTANQIQRAVQDDLATQFTLRRPDFIKRTIYRKPGEDFARKAFLVAAVRVDERRDLLAKFQKPGTKVPRQGRSLSLPGDVKRNKADIVTRGNRPRAFNLQKVGQLTRGDRRTFVIERGGAPWLLLQRVGRSTRRSRAGRAATGRDPQVRVLWIFKRSVRIPKRLPFYEQARRVVRGGLNENLRVALADAIRTAR